MTSDDSKSPKAAIWTMMFALATAIVAYWQFQALLISSRPAASAMATTSTIGDQKFLARLWQDPLVNPSTNHICKVSALRSQIIEKSSLGSSCEIIPVMIEGFPYAEDVEARLRTRHAVETAVFAAGYEPLDRSHLGMIELDWPRTFYRTNVDALELSADKAYTTLRVPFEWAQKGTNNLLILWLQEEQFADYPLTRYALLMTNLDVGRACQVKVIGPRSSDTLRAMLNNLSTSHKPFATPWFWTNWFETENEAQRGLLRSNVTIYSPSATAPDSRISADLDPRLADPETDQSPRQKVTEKFNDLKPGFFHNCVLTDDYLASALVDELELRQVWNGTNDKNCIALVTESDTTYGRTLPACFVAAAMRVPVASVPNSEGWPSNIFLYSYLRGLDGAMAAAEQPIDQNDTPKPNDHQRGAENSSAKRGPDDYERADGEGQLDYARRIAYRLKDTDKELRRDHHHIVAIGVLGTDTYDKLILLEALRPLFREAVFFCTDLDSCYTEVQERQFTRNLLVASPDGLVPPTLTSAPTAKPTAFRDCYQTSIYKACLEALDSTTKPSIPNAPRRFEIGRSRVIDLQELDSKSWRLSVTPRNLVAWLLGFVGALCLSLLLPVMQDRIKSLVFRFCKRSDEVGPLVDTRRRDPPQRWYEWLLNEKFLDEVEAEKYICLQRVTGEESRLLVIFAGIGVVLVLSGLYFFPNANSGYRGEPFYWNEGVSIWPTELCRSAACVFGILFLVRASHGYKQHGLNLLYRFFGPRDTGCLLLTEAQFKDAQAIARKIRKKVGPVAASLADHMNSTELAILSPEADPARLKRDLQSFLNRIIVEKKIVIDVDHFSGQNHDEHHLAKHRLIKHLAKLQPRGENLICLNRMILEELFSNELTPQERKAPAISELHSPPGLSVLRGKNRMTQLLWRIFLRNYKTSINFWPKLGDAVCVQSLFCEYVERGDDKNRYFRITPAAFSYFLFVAGLLAYWGWPDVPGRGGLSFAIDYFTLSLGIVLLVLLSFFVVDATRLTEQLLERLGDGVSVWPEHLLRRIALDLNADPSHLAGFLDVQFVAYHTQELGKIVKYPFIVLAIMLLGRNKFFAPWSWPPPLLIISLTIASLTFLCAFHIRRAAVRVRNQAVAVMQDIAIMFASDEAEDYSWTIIVEGTVKQCKATNYGAKIEGLIKEIQEIRAGAYAPVLRDDSVGAALIPAVGSLLLAIFQKLFL
jgi:hypothetical protein